VITKKNRPISGGAGQFRRTPNVLSDSAATSRDAQKLVRESPQPFQSRNGVLGVPAPTHPAFRTASDFSKQGLAYGATGRSVSIKDRPTVNLAAVGEPRYPKGYNSVNSGFPMTGSPRVAGMISTNAGPRANGNEMRRLRQTYPGLGIGKWRP
jgi:hypothetical protein